MDSDNHALVRKDPARIAGMFDAIARRYDALNHLLSAGLDRRWRRRAIQALALTDRDRVLDVLHSKAMLSELPVALGPLEGHRLALDVPELTAELGHLIRAGDLPASLREAAPSAPLARVA